MVDVQKKLIVPIWVKEIYIQNKQKTLDQLNRIIRKQIHPDRNPDPDIRTRLNEWDQVLSILKQEPNNLQLLDKLYIEKHSFCQVCNQQTDYEKDLICFFCKTMVHKQCKQYTYYQDMRCEKCAKNEKVWFKTMWRHQPSILFPTIDKTKVLELQPSEEYFICRLCNQLIEEEIIDQHIQEHQDESNELLLEHFLMLPTSIKQENQKQKQEQQQYQVNQQFQENKNEQEQKSQIIQKQNLNFQEKDQFKQNQDEDEDFNGSINKQDEYKLFEIQMYQNQGNLENQENKQQIKYQDCLNYNKDDELNKFNCLIKQQLQDQNNSDTKIYSDKFFQSEYNIQETDK